MTIKKEFANRLSQVLAEKFPGQKQTEISKKLGVSQSTISLWTKAKRLPDMENAIEISVLLDVCVEWLLTGRGEKHPIEQGKTMPKELQHLFQKWLSDSNP